jgi:thiamine-phosphate pyrophosphorylase
MANDCLLYYITDRTQFRGDESSRRSALLAKIAEAGLAGVNYIQLREKDLSARELERLAGDALRVLRETVGQGAENPGHGAENPEPGTTNRKSIGIDNRAARTRLLINSRTDVALAAGADGVHLRSYDVAAQEVRRILQVAYTQRTAERFLVAASCHTAADVHRAEFDGVDFAVFAPVFEKREGGKSSAAAPAGLVAFKEACRAKIPVIALGGVTLGNAGSCLEAGAAGIAGIRLFQENKIEDVVRALRAI